MAALPDYVSDTEFRDQCEEISQDLDRLRRGLSDHERRARREPSDDAAPSVAQLPIIAADSFAGLEIPPRRWVVPELIPDLTVIMLSGDGGVGKSLLALQLAIAVSTGHEWIGTLPKNGPAIFVSAEDDKEELHRRVAAVAGQQGIDLTELRDLHLIPLAGADAVMGAPEGRSGIIRATAVWQGLLNHIQRIAPSLVILDTQADVFAGNEIIRHGARQFIGQLGRLALNHNLAIVLLSHPSLSGISSGTGASGSTAWSNSVRSRLYLEKLKADNDSDTDPDIRVLRVKKANYGPLGSETHLRWRNGAFVLDGTPGGFNELAADAKADLIFLDLLSAIEAQGRDVSPNLSNTYAPSVFEKHPAADGVTRRQFVAAMERLLASQHIHVENRGPPSRRYKRLTTTPPKEKI
jgi:RecA-family ATPase